MFNVSNYQGNANKYHNEVNLTLSAMVTIKRIENTWQQEYLEVYGKNTWQQEYWNPYMLLAGMQIAAAAMRRVQWYHKKLKINFFYDPEIPLLATHTKELKAGTQTDIWAFAFIAAIFKRAKSWAQLEWSSTDKQIK